MSQSDGSAVHIQLVHVDAKLLAHCNGLSGKRLVRLDQIEIVDGHSGLRHYLLRSRHRSDSHDGGIHARKRSGNPGSHGLYAKLLRLLFAHHDHGCSAVVDSGGVGCGHDTVLLECGTKLCNALLRGSRTGAFILIENNGLFFLLHFNGNDLVVELSGFLSGNRLLLAPCGELVQLFSGQSPFLADVLSGDAHVILIESVGQSIVYHGINHGRISHSVSVTSLRDRVRSHGHVLHAARDNHVSLACQDHLGSLVHAVQSGTAYHVHGHGRNLDRQTRLDGRLTRYVLSKSGLDNAAHIYLIHRILRDTGPLQRFFDNDPAQLNGGSRAQAAAHGADGGTACACQYDFLCHVFSSTFFFVKSSDLSGISHIVNFLSLPVVLIIA